MMMFMMMVLLRCVFPLVILFIVMPGKVFALFAFNKVIGNNAWNQLKYFNFKSLQIVLNGQYNKYFSCK